MKTDVIKIEMLSAKIDSMIQHVSSPLDPTKTSVSITLADNFNKILQDAKSVVPEEYHDQLPEQISTTGTFSMLGQSEANATDLLVFLDQVSSILEVLVKHAD